MYTSLFNFQNLQRRFSIKFFFELISLLLKFEIVSLAKQLLVVIKQSLTVILTCRDPNASKEVVVDKEHAALMKREKSF